MDHSASGYYRHCWDVDTETYATSPTWGVSRAYPGTLINGRVSFTMTSNIGADKWWNYSLGQHNHWDPTLLNKGQFWYVENGGRVDYGAPVINTMTYTPSPCT